MTILGVIDSLRLPRVRYFCKSASLEQKDGKPRYVELRRSPAKSRKSQAYRDDSGASSHLDQVQDG